ncbi:hypothetical protein GCM10009828_005550 [Actinoplanes couchii]|uniref:Uncharacterized protein n=1 Tax=Actinoplanes couchii TaxID=403638 RepID=A0ABQ3XIF4_9ACTN|nr:hypothetical protein Aco03nite_066920 [Actinoplanes couchii]
MYFTVFFSACLDGVSEGFSDGVADGAGISAAGAVAEGTADGSTNWGVLAGEADPPVVDPQPARQTAASVRPERARSIGIAPSWQKTGNGAER